MKRRIAIITIVLLLTACRQGGSIESGDGKVAAIDYAAVDAPLFIADSAYSFLETQVNFGFRHPGSKGHEQCAKWLASTMHRWCDTVITQSFTATLWNGQQVTGLNVIASLRPELDKRVLLAAHWDSRQWADHDLDTTKWHSPLMGANDGASGTAVLMELARVMSSMPPDVGVDFVMFDVEDQGITEWAGRYEDNTWCKGSQYWAGNPHRLFYNARYGILFDMVGTANPRFTKEEISMNYATGLTNKMWRCAAALGYGNIFIDELSGAILDDHLYVNQLLNIPTIDIVQNTLGISFCEQWHTTHDDIEAIDRHTLEIVGTVALKLIYGDFPRGKEM